MRLALTLRRRVRDIVALAALIAVAALVGGYILEHQRLRFPVLEAEPFELKAEFSTAQAVTPGQGQTVRVAGVRVGDIAGTELVDGRAVVRMELDAKFDDLVRQDARALLRPKTGLKDMFIELDPGTKDAPVAHEGWTLPISGTLPDVNPDEFLSALDADTRDYLQLLLKGASDGLEGREDDLRQVLKRFEPTTRDLGRLNAATRQRREELRRLVTSLNRLNAELAGEDDTLAQLVANASRTFGALAREKQGVAGTVRELPATLRQASTSLAKVERTARLIPSATEAVIPAVRGLREANAATRPFALEAAPRLREAIRPFVRDARPLVRELRPTAGDLAAATPDLTRTFRAFNKLFDLLAYNPGGREGPEQGGRSEGYLFWLAWVSHQANNVFTNADAHGPGRPVTAAATCTTLRDTVGANPINESLLGLTGVLTDPLVCGEGKDGEADGGAGEDGEGDG